MNLFNVTINRRVELDDVRERRLRSLKRDGDTFEAACWLRQNRDKLVAHVFDPICVEINVKDVQYAHFVETAIGQNYKVNYLNL